MGLPETDDLRYFREIFLASPDFISVSRLDDGLYLDVNPGFERFSGHTREEAIGRTAVGIGLWPSQEDRQAFVDALRLHNGQLKEYPTRLRDKSGQIHDVEFSGGVLDIRGERLLVSMVRDVTTRNQKDRELERQRQQLQTDAAALAKANEELLKSNTLLEATYKQLLETEKMAALSLMVAGIAHEINTPIGTGYTFITHFQKEAKKIADLLNSGAIKKSDLQNFFDLSRDVATQVEQNLSRAAELVKNFKQISVEQTAERLYSFNLKNTLEDIIARLTPILGSSRHAVLIDCPDDIDVHGSPEVLYKIFSNLFQNALTHAFDGEQAGSIRIGAQVSDGRVFLEFCDDGKGIPAEHLPKIFDPFFTTRRGSNCVGLGLSIVFNLTTQKLKGEIRCASEVGNGTIFSLHFPVTAADQVL